MGRVYDELDDHWREWIGRQPMFFVATAPLSGEGHVNLSPKGPGSCLAVRGPREVAYLDVMGSGAETAAHLRENGRIVLMWCAFDGPPRILRLHGRGEVIPRDDERFEELAAGLESPSIDEAARSVVRVDVTRISDSCGYTVPMMEFVGTREHHRRHGEKKLRTMGAEALAAEPRTKNAKSLDGLPAFA